MKLAEFFEKMEHEGGFEPMADYAGPIEIEDDEQFNDMWQAFVRMHEMLDAYYENWANKEIVAFNLMVVGGTDAK